MELENFISTIGYDSDSAIVDKFRKLNNKGKDIATLLEEGSFRAAAAYAVFSNSEEDLKIVVDKYNELSGSNYKKEQLAKLFGVSKTVVKRTLLL